MSSQFDTLAFLEVGKGFDKGGGGGEIFRNKGVGLFFIKERGG